MSNLNQTLSNSISCLQGSKLINTISDILFGSCLAAPVAILCTIFINRTGRKLLFITVATLTGLSIFLIWLIDKTITAQIFATIFTTIAVNGWIPLELWSAELFPTELRASAVGFVNFISGLGFLLGILTFSLIFHVSCTATLLLPAILCTFGGLLSCLLPDTTGADID
ncbi:uncharacterized protein TRIADDRAFT_31314 [Trichoplax adhaerens]|uniref:Major facilitator superfamily (MFS) profile domain-containing protein n=1 Tax=Trichoplax adhaerens TaxID=10228 RepID=B3S925_TRIAD|nr:hypothetical protein TRIADDRAFT_31314 [Trichoplax adhaerens]EDV20724.1 hypothetical protein TRIADDRAFT_31314 [Trichoplax adhaerens]|eukprot:XP_002116665.1 hypothetical protein TRIADDRAFT_31314 [Trichoplax adhaerens]